MESEAAVVNGSSSSEPNIEVEEKILKPRKSILSTNDQDSGIVQNGNSENGTESESVVENGFDEDEEKAEETSKRNLRQQNIDKKENTPKKQPKQASTPPKRELRRREPTPKESTPKPETPAKQRRGTPVKLVEASKKTQELKNSEDQENVESQNTEEIIEISEAEPSVIILEDTNNESKITYNSGKSDGEKSIFSVFRWSQEAKDRCEASSSQNIICLDSPSVGDEKSTALPNSADIRGRRPINSFSRFPGRNVSFKSLDYSRKRRADESFIEDEEEMKRFAGETESGSEKSPGWTFFPRIWSPTSHNLSSVPCSTPVYKKADQDSMKVNYNEETKLSLGDTMDIQPVGDEVNNPNKTGKWCIVM